MGSSRGLVLLVVAGLVAAAACGSRLPEDELSTARAGRRAGVSTATSFVPGSPSGGATDSTAPAADGGRPATDGDTASRPTQTTAAAEGSGAAACKGKTASDVGITPTQVKIGQIATIGGPVPGFGQTGRNALRAFIAYINSQGGVCGRQLVMLPGDDRLEAGANRAETERLMKQVFAFVSNTSVADDGGAVVLKDSNVPQVGLSTSEAAGSLATNFSPSPIPYGTKRNGAGKLIGFLKKQYGVKSAALVWPAAPVARTAAERYENDLKDNDIPVEVRRQVAVTETNFSGVASEIANKKIDLVLTTLEFNAIARLARAFQTQGYLPKVPFYGAQTYGRKFLEVAGAAANGTKLGVAYEVFESAQAVPEVALFLQWYQRVNPGEDVDFFAIMAWVSARMFAEALAKAGPEPTRDSILRVLRTFTDYDGRGFVGHINPAQKQSARCFLIVEVVKGRWVKSHPKGAGFQC